MTFGSILSATDPVAVAALLEEVGAPPRLKTHIAGESLLNDGSAIVFYSIFSQKFFYELGIEGFGEDIDFAKGVAMFCQKALGGCAFGIIFGFGILLVLFLLDRRFNKEENVVQVTAVLALAYLNYYVSDFVAHTSGVIATVVAGLIVKFLGRASVNDIHLMDDFFVLVEHILNTILFSLGGVVWGGVIVDNHRNGVWTGKDWGYLIALYLILSVIRLFLFVVAYPITVRTGLSTNWAETMFQVHGGLRGAVGIALAISLDNEVFEVTPGSDETIYEIWTTQAYQMVGGIALITLVSRHSQQKYPFQQFLQSSP
jgi:NhaP-type Na+/H+ or K+/H+ antiporter